MIIDILNQLRSNRKLQIVIASAVLLIIVFIAVQIVNRPDFNNYAATKTSLNTESSFAYLSGNSIYDFNGAAFSRQDITSGSLTVLSSGTKLPAPKEIHWAGSRGALMTFESSFIATAVEEYLQKSGESVTEATSSYVWYFDFKSGNLSLISRSPLMEDLVFYSEKQEGFYYLTEYSNNGSEESFEKPLEAQPALNFFDLKTATNSIKQRDIPLVDIKSLQPCADAAQQACVVARHANDLSSQQVFAIGGSDKPQSLLKSKGRILATSSPKYYIATDPDDNKELDDDVDYAPTDTYLHDLTGGKAVKLDYRLANENLIINFVSDEFYAITNRTDVEGINDERYESGYLVGDIRSGKTRLGDIKLKDGTTLENPLVENRGTGKDGVTLAANEEGALVLFAPENISIENVEPVGAVTAEQAVRECRSGNDRDTQYFESLSQFKIYYPQDANFKQNIRSFTGCIASKNVKLFIGYDYYFGGTSPTNGRIITD